MAIVNQNIDTLMLCYNKGCGSKFKIEENNEGSCCYHPGSPVFHDAYKGWSCCNKKSTDFTTFLNMKGCFQGKHNPVKPEEPVKQKPNIATKDEVITVGPGKEIRMERPDFNTKLERLKITISLSLKDALNKEKEKILGNNEDDDLVTKIGESCKNNGCRATYEGEHSNLGLCKYHPGIPVFHEGMKYWHCCQRKTSDFELFLQQEGCSTGSHLWKKKNLKKANCRYDWHQTNTHTIMTVYAKLSRPEATYVEANPIRLKLFIAFGDKQQFELDSELGGIIVPQESSVTMAATKVEMKLRKAEPSSWQKLFLPIQQPVGEKVEEKPADNFVDSSLSVDNIDLNDL